MGLLSRANTLDEIKSNPGLVFSDFIKKHSLKTCAILEKLTGDYVVSNSFGLDASSILSATSTSDFWEGTCPVNGLVYNFKNADKTQLLQLFSFTLKDNFSELSLYKNASSKILITDSQIPLQATQDFEKISNEENKKSLLSLNPFVQEGSVVVQLEIDFYTAAESFFKEKNTNVNLSFDLFLNALSNELYNRFICRYNISGASAKKDPHCLKTVIVTDKYYSVNLISHHLLLNLKDVLENYSELIQIKDCGTAASCNQLQAFFQAE